MQNTIYSIIVGKKDPSGREVWFGIEHPENPVLQELSNASLSNIKKTLNLKPDIDAGSFIDGYEFLQTQRVTVELNKQKSIINDFIFNVKNEIETDLIFSYLQAYAYFLETENNDSISDHCVNAFNKIKIDPGAYRVDDSNLYRIRYKNLSVSIIEENQFLEDAGQFRETLKISPRLWM